MLIPENELPQGSDEWLEWRKAGIGGSEVFALAAYVQALPDFPEKLANVVKPTREAPSWVATPIELYREAFGFPRPEIPEFLASRGHRFEALARELLEDTIGVPVPPVCVQLPDRPICRVSLDGYNEEEGVLMEVKAPTTAWEYCPEYVIWQTAYQRAVLEAGGHPVEVIHILEIGAPDEEGRPTVRNWDIPEELWIKHLALGKVLMLLAEHFYEQHIQAGVPPQYLPNELLHVDGMAIDVQDEWIELGSRYRSLKHQIEALEAEQEAAREELLALTARISRGQPGAAGFGTRVRLSEPGYRTNYQRALQALVPDADLTPYRTPGQVGARITLSGS